jgi:hypothetical protein
MSYLHFGWNDKLLDSSSPHMSLPDLIGQSRPIAKILDTPDKPEYDILPWEFWNQLVLSIR